uniref:CBM20 domain-containing protein n=1 Tax=Dunaliella tertiolecta TaxID=3047 RepID=A0A7S3QWJ9_DUNTE
MRLLSAAPTSILCMPSHPKAPLKCSQTCTCGGSMRRAHMHFTGKTHALLVPSGARVICAQASGALEGGPPLPLPRRQFTPKPLRHVRFIVPHYVMRDPGQVLAVVGSWKELGSWNPSKAEQLERMPEDAWSTDLFLPAEDGLEFKVILVRENQGCIECVRWEPGRNRVLDLKHSAQECQEPLDVTCWWGIKPKDSSPSDLDAAIVAAVGVEPLVGLLDSPQPHEQEAAAAAMCKLACSKSSKRFWRGEIAAAGALPGLQRVADSFKATHAAREYASRTASKVQDAARELEKREKRSGRRWKKG